MGIKELFLQKGWAGRTIDRAATIDRINPMIRTMNELMQLYIAASETESRASMKQAIEDSLRTLRMDIGKMCEIVFSCGGVAYSGTDLETGQFRLGSGQSEAIAAKEAALRSALGAEAGIEHQMRTRAILQNVDINQKTRMEAVRGL
ncbi:MAG: hypothetical protein O3C45_03730 [Bacteroidetes bacterium]|nr:hypothetical protein [Bacteroidota bacterium]